MKFDRRNLAEKLHRAMCWSEAKVPSGLRSLLGLVLMAAGTVGFLPILGFWMLPLGVAMIALDVPPLRRRLYAWVDRQRAD